MESIVLRLVSLPFIVVLSFCVSASKYEELEKQHKETSAKLVTAEQKLSDQKVQLDKMQTENRSLGEQLKKCSSRTDSLTGQNRSLQQELSRAKSEANSGESKLKETIAGLQKELEAAKEANHSLSAAATKEPAKEEDVAEQSRQQILSSAYQDIIKSFDKELGTGDMTVQQLRAELRISVQEEILFGSGSVALSENGKEFLRKFSSRVQKDNFEIFIEGHTDSVGIGAPLRKRYPTNWDLGAARAVQVVRFMHEKLSVRPQRLGAASFSWYRPVTEGNTPEERAKNRRIEIVLVHKEPIEKQPGQKQNPEENPEENTNNNNKPVQETSGKNGNSGNTGS